MFGAQIPCKNFSITSFIGIHNNVAFRWSGKTYDYHSHPSFRNRGSHRLHLEYPSMEVNIESQVPLVDFNGFISSVGGSLGLFLGFSIIDTMLFSFNLALIYNVILLER